MAVVKKQYENPLSLQDATEILTSKLFFQNQIQEASESVDVDLAELNHASHILAHAVMVHSLRRPAAVQEATLAEYHRGSWEIVKGTQAFVVPVAKHKTMATHGRARLVFDGFLKNKTDAYIDAIRPRLLQPNEEHPNLSILLEVGKFLDSQTE